MSPPEAPAKEGTMMANTAPGGAMMMSSGGKVAFTNLENGRWF